MKSFRKPCVARMEEPHKQATMQRHTISGEKSCVVTRGRTRRRETVQRHTFLIRKACVADRDQVRRRWFVQRHTFSREKTCIASTEREKKADVMQRHTIFDRKTCVANRGRERKNEPRPHCTTRYDHPTKPQHIISHHITTISKPDNTTNRQNPIPCLKHHTLQHYTTKALPPKSWRKSFIDLSANRLS